MKQLTILAFAVGSLMLASCNEAFWQGMAQGAQQYAMGMSPYGYNPYMGYSPVTTSPRTNTSSTSSNSLPIKKELKIESNGFKWYNTKQGTKEGAEDYNHNTLIPLSRGYTFIVYHPREGLSGYFCVWKNDKIGACDATGKEVISPIYKDAICFSSSGFNYKNSNDEWVPIGMGLDDEGRAVEKATKVIEFPVELTSINGDLITDKTKYKFRYECYKSRMEFKVYDGSYKEIESYIFIPSSSILTYGNAISSDTKGYGKAIKIQFEHNGVTKMIKLCKMYDLFFNFLFIDSFDSAGKAKDKRIFTVDLGDCNSKYNELSEAVKQYSWNRTIHDEKETDD